MLTRRTRQSRRLLLALTVTLIMTMLGAHVAFANPFTPGEPPVAESGADGAAPDPTGGDKAIHPDSDQLAYYLVQFRGPITELARSRVAKLGALLLQYRQDYAFKARMTPTQADRIARLSFINRVSPFLPSHRLSPDLVRDGVRLYRVSIEAQSSVAAALGAVTATGARLLARQDNYALVAADSAQLAAMAQIGDVDWIENFQFYRTHNEYGGGLILGANAAIAAGYDGSSQIAAVADTGLGLGISQAAHQSIPAERVRAIFNWSGDDALGCYRILPNLAQDVSSGHGTHVAASVVGAGDGSGRGRGTAPAARLVFQAVEEYVDFYGFCESDLLADGYALVGIPTNLRPLFQQAYNAGARVHSNSWGAVAAGRYTLNSAAVDAFIWAHPDMTIVYAAGNSGVDRDGDGVVDPGSLGSPATAKNAIAVGASENDRQSNYNCDPDLAYTQCGQRGGQNLIFTYGGAWPESFPAAPLKDDAAAGNQEQMAAFSSRGPTADGRIKPDLVAPGTYLLSGYSDLYQQGYDPLPNPVDGNWQSDGWGDPANAFYKYFGGTSMAAPLVAGAATLVRDYYRKAHSHNASAALVKATLINSAEDLLDENNDGVLDNAFPIPNIHEGWGRVNVAAATDGRPYIDRARRLRTGDTVQHRFQALGDQPLKITLVWSDAPGSPAAAQALVNDLDLEVRTADGSHYLGNVFSGGWSQSGGERDRVNNVENVYLPSPAEGPVTVRVSAHNVPVGAQNYALVVSGGSPLPDDNPPAVQIVQPQAGARVMGTIVVRAEATDDIGVTRVEFSANQSQVGVDSDGSDGWTASVDTRAFANGPLTLEAVAVDTIGQSSSHSVTVAVDNPPARSVHIGDLDGTSVRVGLRQWRALVTLTVHDHMERPIPNASASGWFNLGAPVFIACTTDRNGQCTISTADLSTKLAAVRFTVRDVIVVGGFTYRPEYNHDPDGDSSGTRILISRPRP